MGLETWELLSYVVTVVGLPLAICVFLYEQRRERENEEEEVYQLLSDNYQEFLKVALDNPDLRLFSTERAPTLTEEQRERQVIIFFWGAVIAGILVGLVVGLTGAYASEWSLMSMYLLFIVVVTFRARGLFGRKSALDT